MERNKCRFFDIDGVLNRKSQWKKPYSLCDECIRNSRQKKIGLRAFEEYEPVEIFGMRAEARKGV